MRLKPDKPALAIAALLFVVGVPLNHRCSADPPGKSLFNGSDLSDWDGDPRFWSVDQGQIVGQTTKSDPAEQNTFLIYRGGSFGDFDLTFSYKVRGYNSGVQYRSKDEGDWVVSGYQADFEDRWHKADGGPIDKFSGMFFEEKGRMFLGQRGQAVVVNHNAANDRKPKIEVIGNLGSSEELEELIRRDDWNHYRVIAKGYQFTHIINGRVMSVGIDHDVEHRSDSGVIAFQLHSGPPMEIRLKDIHIKDLSNR